jgi:hypothetical protein
MQNCLKILLLLFNPGPLLFLKMFHAQPFLRFEKILKEACITGNVKTY